VFLNQRLTKARQIGDSVWADSELIRVSSPFMADRNRLTTPDELCSTRAKAVPTAQRQICGPAIGSSVPTFHRLNSEAISQGEASALQRKSERRRISREHLHITRNRDVMLLQVTAKYFYVANAAQTKKRILIHEELVQRRAGDSPRSGRQHKAWGVAKRNPRIVNTKTFRARGAGDRGRNFKNIIPDDSTVSRSAGFDYF
jgi:hypothetical protein